MSFDTTYLVFVDRVLSGEYLANLLGVKSSSDNGSIFEGGIYFLSTKAYPISKPWSPVIPGISTVWKYCIEIDCRYSHLIPFRGFIALLISKKISETYGADVLGADDKEYGFYIRSGKTYADVKNKFLTRGFPLYDEYYNCGIKFVRKIFSPNECDHLNASENPCMLIDGVVVFPFSFFGLPDSAAVASEKPERSVTLTSGFYQSMSGDIDASGMGSGLLDAYFVKASALDPEFSEISTCAIFNLCHDMVRMNGVTGGVEVYLGKQIMIKIEGGVTYYNSQILKIARQLKLRIGDLYLMDLPFLAGV